MEAVPSRQPLQRRPWPSPALQLYDRPGAFDAVVLDLSMPVLGGREVRARLHARDPDLRSVFVTGFSAEALVPIEGQELLEKPVDAPVLVAALRRALARR